jgi:hypothetical protein
VSDTPPLSALSRLLAENGYFRRSNSTFLGSASYKEWLHFAVHAPGLDLLANFSMVDDIRAGAPPGAEIPRVVCLVREQKWEGDIDQYAPGEVRLDTGRLSARFGESRVTFEDGRFHLVVRMRRKPIELDLHLTPLAVPTPAFNLQVDDCPPINWMVVPRLVATGTVRIGDRVHHLKDAAAYHDHNWGHFRWGKNFAWEWGYGAPDQPENPWTMVFVRLTDRGHVTDLMQAVFLWKGPRQARLFRANELEVWHQGLLRASSVYKLPRVMGLVSPGTATDVPERLQVRAAGAGDHVEFEFRCQDIAQVIIPNDDDLGVTIINEVAGQLELAGLVRGERFTINCPAIFEFLGE